MRRAVAGGLAIVVIALAGILDGAAAARRRSTPTAPRSAVLERVEWEVSDSGARVIVVVKGKVQFSTHTASPDQGAGLPPRAYLDLTPAQLGRDIAREPIAVHDRLVARIRIGQFDRQTVRVVVDLTEPARLEVDTAERPSRLILTLAPAPAGSARPPAAVASAGSGVGGADAARTPALARAAPSATPAPRPTRAIAPSAAARSPAPEPATPEPRAPPPVERAPAAASSPSLPAKREATRQYTVVLDPGHGGDDPGARGVSGDLEKSLTLAVVEETAERLADQPNVRVVLTRSEDVTVPLAQRTAAANAQGADLFLSVHANASDNPLAVGIETYTLNNTNDRATMRLAALENGLTLAGAAEGEADLAYILSDLLQTGKEDESQALAEAVQENLVRYLRTRWRGIHDLGVKRGPFYVLVGAYMPCVLIEVGFLTNDVEGQRIATARYQRDLADGIASGIRRFLQAQEATTNL